MILDPNGIAAMTGELSVENKLDSGDSEDEDKNWGEDQVALLVFRAGDAEPKAVPLSLIARLEEIDVATIEHSNNRMVVQYRGKLMPLVGFSEGDKMVEDGRQPILVFTDGERSMGLIVEEIVDIVEEVLNIELASEQDNMIGSAVVAGKATGVIDTSYYLSQAFGDWFRVENDGPFGSSSKPARVLLVDDSAFFRNLLAPILATAGYHVASAANSAEALKMRDDGAKFDVIVSDIEMPGQSGFEFAEEVKSNTSKWANTPMIAMSGHTTAEDMERGRDVGFADYVPKSNREALLTALRETLHSRLSS